VIPFRREIETFHQHFLTVGIVEVPSYVPASAFKALYIIEDMEKYIRKYV